MLSDVIRGRIQRKDLPKRARHACLDWQLRFGARCTRHTRPRANRQFPPAATSLLDA
jgi:hypothetical protein